MKNKQSKIKYYRDLNVAKGTWVWIMILPPECQTQFSVLQYDEWKLGINYINRLVK